MDEDKKPIHHFHKMILRLEELQEEGSMEITYADFDTGEVRVVLKKNKNNLSFEATMATAKFVDMAENMKLRSIDFKTGEVSIELNDTIIPAVGLTRTEIELMANGKKINAIKEYRLRTNLGLADSKKAVERGWELYSANYRSSFTY